MVKLNNPISIKSALVVIALAMLFTLGAQKVIASCCGETHPPGQRWACVPLTNPHCPGGTCTHARCQYQWYPSPAYHDCTECAAGNECAADPNDDVCCGGIT